MRIVGYCRVSTDAQANEGVSLDAQRLRFQAWCSLRGFDFDPADLHVDAGLSGKRSDNRPGLNAALDAVCRDAGILVVYSLSRLARSVKDTLAIAERIERAGADLVSLSEQLDTTTASGKMLFRLLAVLAEFERDLISERTKAALNHKRARSERIGQVPYGSRLEPDGRTLVPDEGEHRVLAWIRGMDAEGKSLRAIAAELDGCGIPTKRGGPMWAVSTIKRLIANGKHHAKIDQGGAAESGQAQPQLPAP
jgi:site-specific DNA recombinase